VWAAAKDGLATFAALATYQARIVPRVRRELGAWRRVAEAIGDPEGRAQALAAIDQKGLNVEATAVFAILAPRPGRADAIRAMVALQTAIDYLDTVGERTSLGDGAYLDRLFGAFRDSVRGMPSQAAVSPGLERAIGRCGEGQAATHAAEHGDGEALEIWALAQKAPASYRWWEIAAGGSSSVAAHALIAAAADRRTTPAEVAAIDAAYFPPIGALTVLLDDLIDRDEDAAAGAHNYTAYYRDGEEAAERLELLVRLARASLDRLRHRHRHAAILAGVAGFYLSAAGAQTPYAEPARERLLASAGPAVRSIVALMGRRRRD
jgi:tetraprenyl-beta-curcumene synthase